MSKDNIQITLKVIMGGLVAGIVASLWKILPFFVPGLGNLILITLGAAIILLLVISNFKQDALIKSGIIASIIFLFISFAIVPLISGIMLKKEIDIAKYTAQGFETVELKLPGLFCSGCAYSAQTALKGVDGVVDAKVSYDSKSGIIVYDPNIVTPQELVEVDLIKSYEGKIK